MKTQHLSPNDGNWTNTLANCLDELQEGDILVLSDPAMADLAEHALRRRQDHKYIRIMTEAVYSRMQIESGEQLEQGA